MPRPLTFVCLAAVIASNVFASPYWVAYEGDVLPEDDGWHRTNIGDGPADRTIDNGVLTIDSLWSDQISDFYRIDRPIDPEPGELFVAEWRLRVVENIGGTYGDSGVTIAADMPATLSLRYMEDSVSSSFEAWTIPIVQDVFHIYRIESSDMLNYDLFIDGAYRLSGTWFVIGGNQSFAGWGDAVRGASSRTEWDYFRFGVVPEPAPAVLVIVLLFAGAFARAKPRTSQIPMLACLAIGIASNAFASPYWVSWEGNDYPEDEGWRRITHDAGPADRSLDAGIMTMDGLANTQIDDYYRMQRPLDPAPGEEFVMQWRLRVHTVVGSPFALFDPGLELFSDDDWALALVLGTDFIFSFHENVRISFDSGEFHSFEVRSSDMQSYELRIDGAPAYVGSFWEPSSRQSRIQWGDYARGSASLVDWDYFRFGVVPEPTTSSILTLLFCALYRASRRT